MTRTVPRERVFRQIALSRYVAISGAGYQISFDIITSRVAAYRAGPAHTITCVNAVGQPVGARHATGHQSSRHPALGQSGNLGAGAARPDAEPNTHTVLWQVPSHAPTARE
jgi:hypothetical protein